MDIPLGQPHPSRGKHVSVCARAASRGARTGGGCSGGGSSVCRASRPHRSGMVSVTTRLLYYCFVAVVTLS